MARRLTGRLAYDAPESPEQNEILSPEYFKVLIDWAKEADLDYEQWAKFNEILKALSDPKGDYIDGSYVSGDEPPDFPGKPADSDDVGHAFQYEVGQLFRSEVGRDSDLMSATLSKLPEGQNG